MSSKQPLVYGIVNDNLVLLSEDTAKAFVADHEAIRSFTTYDDARRFQPQAMNVAPGLDDDDYDEIPADEDPYDAALTNEYLNGDWPPPAAAIALNGLPDDLDDIGEQVEHFPNVPILYVDPAMEAHLILTLTQRGYEVRRDDVLISRI